jgi:hypothetical protein
MNQLSKRKRYQRLISSILCLVLLVGLIGFGDISTVKAEISPLITPYKPQVQNVDVDVSYTDSSGNTISGTIHHPGIALSQADLDNMRDHVRAGNEPWNTAFHAFASDRRSSKTPRIHYDEENDLFVNIRGPWAFTDEKGNYWANPSEHVGNRANWDSETAFHQAIMWYITGDETYRSNAMYIIRAYAGIQSVVPHTNFRFATMTYLLGAAAEILRYSDTPTESLKWTAADTQNLSKMMDHVRNAYEGRHPNYFMNQHQFALMGIMARAIFTNDLELYAEAVEATMVNAAGEDGGRNGSIKQQMRMMTKNEMTGEPLDPSDYHVQLMEMGRDMGHTYANIAGLSTLAQTIYAQGTKVDPIDGTMSTAANAVNPFNFLDDRLLEGITYALKYNLGYDVPWTPAVANQSYFGQIFDKIQPRGERGRIDAFYSVLYNYYKYIEQQDMTQEKFKYLAYAYETRMPEVAGKDYPLAMLLYMPDAAKTDGLSNRIILGDITGLTATMAGSDVINLSWTAVPDALGYNIYRSTEENGTYTQINSAPITTTSYSDTSLTPNTIYYYKVHVSGGSTSGVVSATTGGDGIPALDVSSYELPVNHTHQSVLRVIHPDRSIQDLTSQASFTSSDPAVATVDSAGLVTGISVGIATITAAYNGQNYEATVNVVVDTGLNTWLKFDETSGTTAADASGYGNNATINGGVTWTSGQIGNAVNLDGTNGYIALPEGVVSSADSITVAAWVNLDTVSNWSRIFDFGSGTSTNMYLTPQNGANGNIRFGIKNNNSSEEIIDGTSALATGGWHHVAVTLNGSIGILYVDGSEVGRNTSMTIKPSDMGATTQNWIGRSQYSDPYLDGRVDDFRIYNRAISSSEVTSLMNEQTLKTVTTAPKGVTATTADQSSINLSWSAVPGATGYHVYISDSLAENAIYTKVNHDVVTETTYTSQGLKENTTYYYKVTAVNAVGESSMSAIASATTNDMANANLVSWLKFDETSGTTAVDASGYGHNGTLNGGAIWTTGQIGNAVELDGTDGYIALPAGVVSDADSITVASWVNLDTVRNWTRIFDFGSGTSTNMYLTPQNGANGNIRFGIKNNNSSEEIIDGTSALATGGWHHVAVTLNGSTGILYVDGKEVGRNTSMTIKPSDLRATNQNWIGRSQYPDPYLDGRVDDFRIYNQALPADEIAALATPELIAWYKLDQTSGTTAADASGYGHNGTLHGSAVWTEEGKIGGAIDLAGSSQITLPASSISSDELTVATWVNWRGGNAWQRIFDFGNNTSQYMFLTPRSGGANTLRFVIRNGGSEQMIQTSQLPVNEWVHVAVTLGNGTATLYVDGEAAASADGITIKPSDFNPVNNYIGKSQWSDPLFNGMIDEFSVFSKALSAEEISALFNRDAVWNDHTLLNLLLEEADAVDADLHTEESAVTLEAAVAEARQIATNANASQEEIDAVCVNLSAALEGLKKKLGAEVQPSEPSGKNGWQKVPVKVVLNPSEQVEYSLNEGSSWALYEGPVTLREEGIHQVLYRYGNANAEEDVKSLEVKIDLTPPQVDIVGETSYTIDREIIISCIASDETSSVYGTPCDQPLLQIMAYELEPGEHTETVEVEDMAGHHQTAQWTFVVEATYDSLAVLSERFVTETGEPGGNGIVIALKRKLSNAKQASERDDYEAAQDLLQSYIDQVKDLTGNKLSEAKADVLVRWAEWMGDTMPID